MKLFTKVALVVAGAMTLVTTAGVSATWLYAEYETTEQVITTEVSLKPFYWEGSTETQGGQGEDHKYLLDNIIEDLNSNDSYLEDQILDRQSSGIFGWYGWDTFGSMDVRDEAQIKDLFGLEAEGLNFLIYFPKNNKNIRYVFTTSVDMGTPGTGNNYVMNIAEGKMVYSVYRTTLELIDGNWVGVVTELGAAPSKFYDNDWLGSLVVKCPSFDPTKWVAGKQGTSTSNAIYAYVGLSTTAYVDSETEASYYVLTSSASGTRTVTTYNANVHLTVTSNNSSVSVKKTTNVDAEGKTYYVFTYSVTNNRTYYMCFSGDKAMTFTLT